MLNSSAYNVKNEKTTPLQCIKRFERREWEKKMWHRKISMCSMAGCPGWEVHVFYTLQGGRWRPRQMAKDYFNKHLLSDYNEHYQGCLRAGTDTAAGNRPFLLLVFLQERNLQCRLIHFYSLFLAYCLVREDTKWIFVRLGRHYQY